MTYYIFFILTNVYKGMGDTLTPMIFLIVFGAGKLPQIGSAIGKSIHEFKKAQRSDEEDKPEDKKASAASTGDTAKK